MIEEKGEKRKPVILVTNDDGYKAAGIKALVEMVKPFGRVVVVAPEEAQSGMSHAITIKTPLRLSEKSSEDDVSFYTVNGTPVDCVKLAMSQLFSKRLPDLVVSGINHGSNSSISIIYSGTMAAAVEGCLYGVPSIGFSLLDYSEFPDFSGAIEYGRVIVDRVLTEGLSAGCCLNVNVPVLPLNSIKGIRFARQNRGTWREEFEKRTDPRGEDYYWLTGYFHNDEPNATDTDEYWLKEGYVSVVPIQIDLTNYKELQRLKSWSLEDINLSHAEKNK
ncbi:MAG: 5/3-nucleotidase [Tenuifilum sp.]|jgi:5'-nucleotidase|uniref:5'/3'-nucleotidase SurE n=1 Tax=Tenuifilum sp. TaxID=2760880 RepID=UPI0024ABAEFD|nr:5'/3'-nucleotidase SurE [Tenuifilum sp.]MDI3526861.1 5/3-nucleotidase [Tenuifilum sp.]